MRRKLVSRQKFDQARRLRGFAQCGDQETWLARVTWFLNDYTWLKFNYTELHLSGYPTTVIPAGTTTFPAGTRVSGFDDATVRGFGMRAHIDW